MNWPKYLQLRITLINARVITSGKNLRSMQKMGGKFVYNIMTLKKNNPSIAEKMSYNYQGK